MNTETILENTLKYLSENKNLCLEWCTGLGKSRAALEIISKIRGQTPTKVLLLIAEVPHRDNWIKEVLKWNKEYLLGDITIECYASLKKHKNEHYDVLILDEGHHGYTDLRLDTLETITANHVIVLSATIQSELIFELKQIFGDFFTYKITLKEAIANKIIPEPTIYLIPLSLDNRYRVYPIIEERGLKNRMVTIKCPLEQRWKYLTNKKDYPHLRLEMLATQVEKNLYLSASMDYYYRSYMTSRSMFHKNKWLRLGSERKRFLGECKTEMVQLLLSKINKLRTVCFCSSIPQAETLGGKLAIHSEKSDCLDIIDKFNNKKIDRLFAVDMIKEGQNLEDIEAGIIIQLGGKEREFIQKMGRALRAKEPIQFIFYYKGTRDEEFLTKTVLPNTDPSYIYVIDNLAEFEL